MPHVMFICTGNICRSPMAEAIFKDLLQQHGLMGEESDFAPHHPGTGGDPNSGFPPMGEEGRSARPEKARGASRTPPAREGTVSFSGKETGQVTGGSQAGNAETGHGFSAYSRNWQVSSAGTYGVDGAPASRLGQVVMQERGLDTSQHVARTVTPELVASADLLLVMGRGHQEALLAEFPGLAGRVWLLSEAAGSRGEVADPYGGTLEDYRETADLIADLLETGFDRVVALAEQLAGER